MGASLESQMPLLELDLLRTLVAIACLLYTSPSPRDS